MMTASNYQEIVQQAEIVMIAREQDTDVLNRMREMNRIFAARESRYGGLLRVVSALDQQPHE